MKHPVYDTDKHFTVDPVTGVLGTEMKKITLVKRTHNSERFTFKFPRTVEGHDLSLCDKAEVHFLNIDAVTKETSKGTYAIEDVQASEEDVETITFSWLIDGRATEYVGSLHFSIHFKCEEAGKLLYRWPTATFSNVQITDGVDNGDVAMEEYKDIVTEWMHEIEQSIDETVSKAVDDLVGDAVDKAVEETVGDAVDKAIEDTLDQANLANAIKANVSGTSITIDDLSPLTSKLKVKVVGKQPPEAPAALMMMRSTSPAATGDELVNLIPYPYADGVSKTLAGMTFLVDDGDGSVTLGGKMPGSSVHFDLYNSKTDLFCFTPGKNYIVSGGTQRTSVQAYYYTATNTNGTIFLDNYYRSGLLPDDAIGILIRISPKISSDYSSGETIYPMIVEGDNVEITNYVPPLGLLPDGGDHTHRDDNKDHFCDDCGVRLSACVDNNKDHYCDTCGKKLTECVDADLDHDCDTCGKVLSECEDPDLDHDCDHCGATMGYHADGDKDHKCDYCGKVLSECEDNDPKDHYCDYCGGSGFGAHADDNGDGLCDYCGEPIIAVTLKIASADDPDTIIQTIKTTYGAIVELTPIFPSMIITTDKDDALLSAEYNKDTNAVIEELREAIGEGGGGGGNGQDGKDGITPRIGENGNWWIGDTDTGKLAVSLAEGAAVVPTTGNREDAVMSQKATTQAIKDATEYGEAYDRDITDTLTLEIGCYYSKLLEKVDNAAEAVVCTSLIPVNEGDFFKITATYGYYAVLIAEFDEAQTMISYNGLADAGTAVTDYEYTVPSGVSFIAISNRDQKYNPMVVKRYMRDTVKEKVDKNAEAVEKCSAMMLLVENGITNGNFETTDGWTVDGGTLSVADNIGKVTPNNTSKRIGVSANFGKYNEGDKVFFKARMRFPLGKGGNATQNKPDVIIWNNTTTGLKYAVHGFGLTEIDWNDYYGIIEFDGAYSTAKTLFGVQYNGAVTSIPADVEFRDIISVNLTKAFGTGNEPTAEEFYSLLDGFENKYFDGEVNLFGRDANFRRIYNDFKATTLTENVTVTVGVGGDFLTLNKAIEYLSNFYPVYKKGGIKCYIKILAGTVINEQIYANQIDLQYITIIAEGNAETIVIDGTSYTMNIVDVDASGFVNTANAHDARGNYPFIAGENAAKLPTIGCVFRLLPDTVEAGKTVCGMLCNRGSEGVVLAASGFDGFNDGCIANNESSITIREGISRNMTRWGVHARHNGEVSARSCVCTNCGIGACADRVADLDVREAVLNGSKVAIECNNISRANANECHAQNCGTEGGYVVMVAGGGIVNCGSFDAANHVGTLYNTAANTLTAGGIIFV